VLNLWALFVREIIHRPFVAGTSCLEGAGCDVVLEEFLVDDVDYCWDEGFDVF
jgi:hypothetical protein